MGGGIEDASKENASFESYVVNYRYIVIYMKYR